MSVNIYKESEDMTVKTAKQGIIKRIVNAAMFLGSLNGTASFSQDRPDTDHFGKERQEYFVDNQPEKLPKHQMRPGPLETGNPVVDKKINQLRQEGAFYLDYTKYKKSKDVKSSVVYFTNEEIEHKGLNKLALTPLAVSRARETGIIWPDDAWKNPESRAKYEEDLAEAICIVDGTFNGIFQFTETNTAKAILYGLVQVRNPELQEFCRGFIRPGIDLDKHKDYQKFRESYLDAVRKFDNGEGSRQDLMRARFGYLLDLEFEKPRGGLFSIMDYSKANFHRLSKANPQVSLKMQETFAVNVYMVMSIHSEKIFNHVDPTTIGPTFSAMIHLPNDSKTVDIIKNNPPEVAEAELIRIHGEPTNAHKRMWVAAKKVTNKGYFGSTFWRYFTWIVDRPDLWQSYQQAMREKAMREILKDKQQEKAKRENVLREAGVPVVPGIDYTPLFDLVKKKMDKPNIQIPLRDQTR